MKKPPQAQGGCRGNGYEPRVTGSYPPFINPDDRSTSAITALLVCGSREGWTANSYRRIADFSDSQGDGLAALFWLREARRCRR